ncbi:MAG: branched-chain amino acid aminotransferase [Flavobacteriaceae bacterium]|nr:branched-chain amino acid aminotransferase [Flavobacteriaceae bacterium]
MDYFILSKMQITKVSESRIHQVDFEHISFGSIFSDHMVQATFENGKWNQPEIIPYGDFKISPAANVFHYGQAVFEGMKSYKDKNGNILLFRPNDHCHRLQKSAKRLQIPPVPSEYFFQGLEELLKLDSHWIKSGVGNSLYVRPFIIGDSPEIQAAPSNIFKFMIICSPAKSYYDETHQIKVLVNTQHSRAAVGGVGYVKAAGNYGAQFFPTQLAIEQGYQQIIWTDSTSRQYIEESGTMNLFFRIHDTLLTPPISDRILDGITRKSVIQIADDLKIPVEIRPIKISEIIQASDDGSLKEIFGTGTAVVICPIAELSYQNKHYIANWPMDTYAQKIKKIITDIQYNLTNDPYGWRYHVT